MIRKPSAGVVFSALLCFAAPPIHAAETPTVEANRVVELTFTAQKKHDDPSNTIELDVTFTAPDGKSVAVPAFWAGGDVSARPLRLAPGRRPHLPHHLLRRDRRGVARPRGRGQGPALRGRQSALQTRPDPRRGGPAPFHVRRRHAVLLARRHVVDGPVRPAEVARRLQDSGRRPARQGLQRHPDRGRPLPGHAGLRRTRPQRGRLPLGEGLQPYPTGILRQGRRTALLPRRPGVRPVHRRGVGLPSAVDGRREDEEALALPDRAVRGAAGGVVRGGRNQPSLLPRQGLSPRRREADGRLGKGDPHRAEGERLRPAGDGPPDRPAAAERPCPVQGPGLAGLRHAPDRARRPGGPGADDPRLADLL